jgi:hypothetical protein
MLYYGHGTSKMTESESLIDAPVRADHHNPFNSLGMHKIDAGIIVRAFLT